MPDKQKQKQKQSVNVTVNLGQARLRRKVKRRVRTARPTKRKSALRNAANYYNQPLTRMIRQDMPTAIPYSVFNPMMPVKTEGDRIKTDLPVTSALDNQYATEDDMRSLVGDLPTGARVNLSADMSSEKRMPPSSPMPTIGYAQGIIRGVGYSSATMSSKIRLPPMSEFPTPRTMIKGYLSASSTPNTEAY